MRTRPRRPWGHKKLKSDFGGRRLIRMRRLRVQSDCDGLLATTRCRWAPVVTLIVPLLSIASTARAVDDPDVAGIEYFEKHIRPIFVLRCYECHSQGKKSESGLLLDSRPSWLRGGDRGPAVVPRDVDASLLVRAVRYQDADLKMPPSQALPAEEIARIEQWIRMGAPAPDEPSTIGGANPSDPVAGKSHWAFQPLAHQRPPAVKDAGWPRSAIDRFVLSRLEGEQLTPAPDAEARDLIRRVTFQLTGLPPTREQVDAFASDTQPDAYERLVDQLLGSSHFGERWGRHWLDLARYADSNGLDENFLFREAWRYRNWVIDAVNADVPFDRFLLEQLAGDRLPFDSVEQRDRQRIGAGFLVVGPKVLLNDDAMKQRMEVADEQIETIGRAILGQTLGCARCHDHKFDPFPTADYYALAGILTSTQVMEKRFMLNEQRVMERLIGLGPDGDAADNAYEEYWSEQPKLKKKLEQAKAVLDALKKDHTEEVAGLLEKDREAFAEGASDATLPTDQRIAAQEKLLAELSKTLTSAPPIPQRAMIPSEAETPADEHIRLSGQFDQLGRQVPRGFLQVLYDGAPAEIPATDSGRVALSRWLTDTGGRAGQLAARVQANRIWHQLIGRGIVRTVDNFGRTGEEPSHPELLDYLATRLVESGWSTKALVREIVLSRMFRLSSRQDASNDARDPDNRLLWRAHRRRLDPESLRDSMLSAAGQLDLAPMESTVSYLGDQATAVGDNKVRRRTDFPCRSVYLPVIRNDLPELFEVFDFADPHAATGARPQTTVPTQGLFVLNDQMVMNAADAAAKRILGEFPSSDKEARVNLMFELILNSHPTPTERSALLDFLKETEERLRSDGDKDADVKTWSLACHALFATSRFQFLE
jgi:hypothetical protein